MGGDCFAIFSEGSLGLSNSHSGDSWSSNVDDGCLTGDRGLVFEEGNFDQAGRRNSLESLDFEVNQLRARHDLWNVLMSYDDLQRRSGKLEEAKSKILSYTPGAWIEKAGKMRSSDYNVPRTTTLLLIGPKGSGKSSLVNKISRVFEEDKSTTERAQVSYNSSSGDGTYFLREYMIPRGSTSVSLYDTRSLSDDSSENMRMLKQWMTKGVRYGELVTRDSDNSIVKAIMKSKARCSGYYSSQISMVNFVIFVVNGLSFLKSMGSGDETEIPYTQMIAAAFKNPFLSFKDDKPVVVVTHGDLISLSDRARVRLHLGELLGIPPKTQIFDIPESNDPATELAIVDMLHYCLERADRNFPVHSVVLGKACAASLPAGLLVMVILGIAILLAYIHGVHANRSQKCPAAQPNDVTDWNAIRHLWLGYDF